MLLCHSIKISISLERLNQSSPFFHHCKGKFMTNLEIDIICSRFFLFLKYSSHLMIAFFMTHPVYRFIKDRKGLGLFVCLLFVCLFFFLFLFFFCFCFCFCLCFCFFQLNALFHKLKLFMNHLRLRSLFVETAWACHVWFNFLPGYTCRTTVIYGTLKDDSLLIDILASNNCLIHRILFQNSVNTLSKMVNHLLSKRLKFYIVRTIRLRSNLINKWSKYLSNNVWRDFRLSMSGSAVVT